MSGVLDGQVQEWLVGLAVPGKPDEHEAKQLFAAAGVPVPDGVCVDPSNCGDWSLDSLITDGPYVVKVCSAEIVHKTDEGGVKLGVGRAQVEAVARDMSDAFDGAQVLIEQMVNFSGSEFIIGAIHDATFGPAIMVGAGGILTELFSDVSFRLAPCSPTEATRMVQELTIYPTLTGFRGMTADVAQLADVVSKVSAVAELLITPGRQIDINPIVWDGTRWMALDAKVLL